MKTAILVPARLASTRLREKMLHEVKGKPVLQLVAERIRNQAPELPLYFAVDDERLRELLAQAGFEAIMTDAAHSCGTDRIAEANRAVGADNVINVQGDQALVTGAQIRSLAALIEGDAEMATLGTPLEVYAKFNQRSAEDVYNDPGDVKLVCDSQGNAIYFSRAPIPYFRDFNGGYDAASAAACPVLVHLGLYAYTAQFLETFSSLAPGGLETAEKLEMLRATEHGYRIAVGISDDPYIEIDTLDQVRDLERYLEKQPQGPETA
ncbi:MAG: 3-deoxy-manno-octulosonate cytidylyltransferase [Gammaproteobacteria bacterium]|nr:3-deoxy-manno-octulosonate cytidylyltransferase [Gammaproteobacteria bacterium]NIP88577.1 3-deoxy-manno-octulosonate cytidylyltransferase [Gammaproteobacteria bacterium]NIR23298.1 3-deoxy-manno-octulosonate cytidylyltransferase [Gammaproteobacteria bacterium]NIS04869.1 3-deoxy-manno-octulosonate cytidylyltransferase [Gammaproteobacteria bacterium]NIU40147.1 3-deoxy-manno-octulosonate cytidylyltransferase [Gammaproteobacteria bacterium]